MKKINPPSVSFIISYETCVKNVQEERKRNQFISAKNNLSNSASEYITLATNNMLYTLNPINRSLGDNVLVSGDITKADLIRLYDYQMINKIEPRKIYDTIKVSTNGKCPICFEIGTVRTLEHYLPKAKFPQFSVHPANLIPSCRDCNFDKSSVHASTHQEQPLHPYYDKDCFYNEVWLHARVRWENIPTIEYYSSPPDHWIDADKERIQHYFKESHLGNKFTQRASEELRNIIDQRNNEKLLKNFSMLQFKEHLQERLNASSYLPNHWLLVMYRALASDSEFHSHDFSQYQDVDFL